MCGTRGIEGIGKMSKVFVVQEQHTLDYSQAEEWGEVEFLTAREYKPLRRSLLNEEIHDEVRRKLEQNFNPKSDWLVLTGNPTMIGWAMIVAASVASSEDQDTLGVLQFDKVRGGYRESYLRINT